MTLVVVVLLGCLALGAAMYVLGRRRSTTHPSLLLGYAYLFPTTIAADVLQMSGAASPVVSLAVTETVTVTLIVMTIAMYQAWAELVCAAWLTAGCLTVIGLVSVLALHPVPDTLATNVDVVGVSLALLVALTTHLGVAPKMPGRVRAVAGAFVWVRAAAWAASALAGFGVAATVLRPVSLLVIAVAYVFGVVVVAAEVRRPSIFRTGPARELPPAFIYSLIAVAVCCGTVAAFTLPSFQRWSVGVLRVGSACAMVFWQLLTARRLARVNRDTIARERYVRSILQDSTDVVALSDARGRLQFVSPAATHVLQGYTHGSTTAAELVGTSEDVFAEALDECTRTGRARVDGRRGEQVLEALLARRDQEVVVSIRDVTERDAMRADLHALAYRDTLTGLPNRNGVVQRLAAALDAAPDDDGLFVLFIDLDRFKHINDASGHHVGDAVLAEVAERLRGCVHEDDVVGRLGGDEFAVVSSGSPRVAARLAHVVSRTLRVPFSIDGRVYQLGGSVGIARSEDGIDPDSLLQRADLAMYEAKQAHRPWRLYEPSMSAHVRRVADRDHDLAQEWGRRAVEIYLQPIVSTRTLEVHSTEALLRWRRADGEIEGPAAALDFAERTGRFQELTGWIVEKVLREIVATPDVAVPVAVNIPPTLLTEPDFAAGLATRVAQLGVPPTRVHLEITEEQVVEQGTPALAALEALHREGFRLHVDDFGTGFSSLSYLVRLPVDALKVDRTFVQEICTSTAARSVVVGLVGLSREVGIDLIAEGVETREQHEALVRLGVAYAQGFWYAGPQAMSDLADRSDLSSWSTGLRTSRRAAPSTSGMIGA